MVRVRAIVRRRKYFSIAPEVMARLGEVHPYMYMYMYNMYMHMLYMYMLCMYVTWTCA
jgi:hypothetical protein